MTVTIVSASPNKDGMSAACAAAAAEGVSLAEGDAETVFLNDLHIGACKACDNGWGTCRTLHYCQVTDDFQGLHERVIKSDALVLVSPVYWGEMSESAKAFTDRLRRCEASRREGSLLAGKPVLAVASAGGTGGGMITCLQSIERWIQHVRARQWDLIPVNRWSKPYKLATIRDAAQAMTRGEW